MFVNLSNLSCLLGGVLGRPLLYIIFKLSLQDEDLGLSFSNFECIHRVLLIQFNEGLFQLNNFLVGLHNLSHYGFLCFLIQEPRIARAVGDVIQLKTLLALFQLLSLDLVDVLRCLHQIRVALCRQIIRDLRLQFVDLIFEISNYTFVSANVEINHFLVRLNTHLDVLRSVRIFQSIYGFFVLVARWTDSCDHHSFTVTSQWIFEHACQLRVSERNKETLLRLISECIDAIGKSKKWCVNFCPFSQSNSSVLSHCTSFWPCKINKGQFSTEYFVFCVSNLILDTQLNLKNGVWTRWGLIGIGRLSSPSFISDLKQTHDLAGLLHLELGYTRELNSFLGVISQI